MEAEDAASVKHYQVVTLDIGRGSRIRTHIDGFGDRSPTIGGLP